MHPKSAEEVFVRVPDRLSEVTKEIMSPMNAQQHPRETKSGGNVSQECRLHSWGAKEAESVTERETWSLHGSDTVNGKEARESFSILIKKLFWIVWNVLWGEKSSFSSRFFSQIAPLSSLEEAVETEVFHSQTFKQTIQNSFLEDVNRIFSEIYLTLCSGKRRLD